MTVEDVQASMRGALRSLPAEVRASLRFVEVRTVPDLGALRRAAGNPHLPDNTRGFFNGQQAVTVDDGDQDGTQEDEPAAGLIVLRADCHRSSKDVEETLFHEIAHALGMDEDEVTDNGLGFE